MSVETIYDHPLYYDVLFGWDRTPEADFYETAFRHHGVAPGERVLEVACGTGQVARVLAHRGWHVTGSDLSEPMLEFLREAATREGVRIDTRREDMRELAADAFGAAYNPLSSFRLLGDDPDAEAHLRTAARALRPGGIYVLDMDFVAHASEPAVTTDEEWEMVRGDVTVRATDEAVHVVDHGRKLRLEWGQEGHLRPYTQDAFLERLAAVPDWTVVGWHPESGSTGEGVSTFSLAVRATPPVVGRTLVVLQRGGS